MACGPCLASSTKHAAFVMVPSNIAMRVVSCGAAELQEVYEGCSVHGVQPLPSGKVLVEASWQAPREFDACILATHSDQALQMLGTHASQVTPAANAPAEVLLAVQ